MLELVIQARRDTGWTKNSGLTIKIFSDVIYRRACCGHVIRVLYSQYIQMPACIWAISTINPSASDDHIHAQFVMMPLRTHLGFT